MKKFLLSAFALFFVLSAVYSVTNMANAGFFDFLRGGDNQSAKVGSSDESKLTISKNKKNGGRVYDSSGNECKTGESSCSKKYTKGETVTLTAEAASGYEIQKWKGCDADGGEAATTCSVNMEKKSESVKIYFKKVSNETSPSLDGGDSSSLSNTTSNSTSVPILTIERKSKNYYGMVEVSSQYATDPGRDSANTVRSNDNCQLTSSDSDSCIYSLPTTVEYVHYTLKAVPSEDSSFKRWTGCDKVEDETCSVTAYNKSETVKVYFKNAMPKKKLKLYLYTDNVNSDDGGKVRVENNDKSTDCDAASCTSWKYAYGSVLTFTATPNSGYEFDKWSGCKSGSNENECEVTMKSNKKVKAYFKKTEEETVDPEEPAEDVTYKLKVTVNEDTEHSRNGYATLTADSNDTQYCMSESYSNPSNYQKGTCEFSYNEGTKVTITPTADSSDTIISTGSNSAFTCKDAVCVVTMNQESSLSYAFYEIGAEAGDGNPTTENRSATDVTSSSATLNGFISTDGDTISYKFKYGTDSDWNKFKVTSNGVVDESITSQTVTNYISGLTPGTTYYYYISAWNNLGKYVGEASKQDNWGSFTTTNQ